MSHRRVQMAVSTWRRPEPDVGIRVARRRVQDVEVVAVDGVLDAAGAPELRACLLDLAAGADVEVDLAGVSFIDSIGVGVLVAAIHRARDHGRRFVVTNARPGIRAVFELTGVDRLLARGSAPAGGGPVRGRG